MKFFWTVLVVFFSFLVDHANGMDSSIKGQLLYKESLYNKSLFCSLRKMSNVSFPLVSGVFRSIFVASLSIVAHFANKQKKYVPENSLEKVLKVVNASYLSLVTLTHYNWYLKRKKAYEKRLKLYAEIPFENVVISYLKPGEVDYKNVLLLPGTSIPDILKKQKMEIKPVPFDILGTKIALFKWSQNIGGNYFENDAKILFKELKKLESIELKKDEAFLYPKRVLVGHSNGGRVIFFFLKMVDHEVNRNYLNSLTIYCLATPIPEELAKIVLKIIKKYKTKLRVLSLKNDSIQDSDIVGDKNFSLFSSLSPNPFSAINTRDTMIFEEFNKLSKKEQEGIDFCQIFLDEPDSLSHINTHELLAMKFNGEPFFQFIENRLKDKKISALYLDLNHL